MTDDAEGVGSRQLGKFCLPVSPTVGRPSDGRFESPPITKTRRSAEDPKLTGVSVLHVLDRQPFGLGSVRYLKICAHFANSVSAER